MTDEELDRAAAFEELIRDRCAERVVETRFGPALFNDTFARIWNLNVVRAEHPGNATAEEIAAEVDRVQARLGHRRVILPLDAEGLENGFRKLGWEADHFLFMAYRGGGEPADVLGIVSQVQARAESDLQHVPAHVGQHLAAEPGHLGPPHGPVAEPGEEVA